jgi:hypothetical protein
VGGFSQHGNERSGSLKGENFLACRVTISFSRGTLLHGISLSVNELVRPQGT